MSNKNKLQEYFQKRNLPVPVYDTQKVGGQPHNPEWVSTVVIDSKRYSSNTQSKKILAEQDVAEMILCMLENEEVKTSKKEIEPLTFIEPSVLDEIKDRKKIILVDLENCPQASEVIEIPKDTVIIGVIGHCHNLAQRSLPFYKCVIPSAMKDAADHALTFLAGYISRNIEGQDIYLVSRDHYAEITTLCLREMGINAFHLPVFSLT